MPSSRALAAGLAIALLPLTGCVQSNYQPPPTVATTRYSRDFDASYNQVWSAVTFVAGSMFFDIKNFDKGSGLLTLEFSHLASPGPYVTCGTLTGGLPAAGVVTPEPDSVLNSIASVMSLSGRANIAVIARGRRTTVQVNSLYDLTLLRAVPNGVQSVGTWEFTSREAATRPVMNLFQRIDVTCRPSYKLENDFLTEVGARI